MNHLNKISIRISFAKTICSACLIIVFLGSCKKFVTIDLPNNRLVTASVFNNNATATAAITSIYSQMLNGNPGPYKMALYTGLSGDEFINYATLSTYIQFYQNTLNSVSSGAVGSFIWQPAYNYIYQANSAISGLETSAGVSSKVGQQLAGEAKLIRAFWYFQLTNLFGDVPLVLSTDYKINASLSRAPKAQVYQQIISDLKDAQNLLNSNYVDVSDTITTTERVRPNKWVATALLARAYLYSGDWVNAEAQATALINNTALYSLVSDLNNVFLKNSTEAIWQLMPVPTSSYNTPEAYQFILRGAPQTGDNFNTALSPQTFNAFETGDNRKTKWVSSITVGTTTYYFPYKYKVYSASAITEYSMVLRLAEQYLIRAESRVQQNNLSAAVADLNIIRNRAGLPGYAGLADKTSLQTAILHERQVELFTEWGHRWMDLKRTASIDAVMSVVTPQKGGAWNTNWQLYPIPFTEIQNNSNLSQNPGY